MSQSSNGRCTCAGSTAFPCWWCRSNDVGERLTPAAIAAAEERAYQRGLQAFWTKAIEEVGATSSRAELAALLVAWSKRAAGTAQQPKSLAEAARRAREATPEAPGDMPRSQCPRCGRWEPDFDGFGILAHVKPGYPEGCGYCMHPSIDGGVCGICGDTVATP